MEVLLKEIYNKPITLKRYHTLDDAKNKMFKHNISRIVIEDDDKPLGIITEKDIARIMLREKRLINEIRLEEVMSRDLITVDEFTTKLNKIATLMLKNKISSIIVVDNNKLKGIVTKSDLVSFYASHFRGRHKVKEYMSKGVITIKIDDTVEKALEVMNSHNISRIIVVRSNEVVGIVTYRNLLPLSAFIGYDSFGVISEVFKGREYSRGIKTFVRDIMTPNPKVIKEEDDLAEAADIMFKNRFSGLPVLNSELRGIITKTDITKAIADIQ